MKNINIIYNYENRNLLKSRMFIMTLTIVLVFVALVVLILLNNIIVDARVNTYLNFNEITRTYRIVFILENLLSVILSPIFLSKSLNRDKNNLFIDNLLLTNITKYDIIIGKFIKAVESILIIILSTLPIAIVSLSFGGISFVKILLSIIFIFVFTLLNSSISLICSANINKPNISMVVSMLIGLILLLIISLLNSFLFNNLIIYTLIIFLMIIISMINVFITIDSHIFEI